MFDVLDYIQEIKPAAPNTVSSGQAYNQQKLTDIAAYRNLTDNWDEDGAKSLDHHTIVIALDIALLLIAHGQMIYHTSPGPVGEIMVNLRSDDKCAEFLIYLNNKQKIVRIGGSTAPWQGPLTPESLRKTLIWLNS